MSAQVLRLPNAKPARKARPRKAVDVVKQAHREADKAGCTRDLSEFHVLRALARLAKLAGPRARYVALGGIRFPLSHGLWARFVVCPRTGRRLVGTVTL